jgi:ATP-dependent exoDNAse (exonuclease V) alpha subunit
MIDIVEKSVNLFGTVKPVPKEIKFNEEQNKACSEIREFLKSKKTYFTLSGKGGTGKTTVIAQALKGQENILGITISHKAKIRLSESIESCYTVASACGMKIKRNIDGTKEFVIDSFIKKKPIADADIIVFDECSMASNKNIKDIHSLKKRSAKVIFLGDFRQLPPIDENNGKDSSSFGVPDNSGLTTRMRQGLGNPIIELSDLIAKEIEQRTYTPSIIRDNLVRNISQNGKGYDYLTIDFIERFVKDYKDDSSTRFISFRNATISRYNKMIRNEMFGDAKDEFIPGELIISKSTFYQGDKELLVNSEEYKIASVSKQDFKGMSCFMITIKGFPFNKIPVLSSTSIPLYENKLKELSHRAKSSKNWKPYWVFKESFAQIDYGYCINSHRSQGSTYRNVYLDFNDVLNVSKITDKEKCQSLYVGITRASHNLYLLDL